MIAFRQWPADPASVSAARRFATELLKSHAPDQLPVLELMISELVTNAVVHTHEAFLMRVETAPDEIRVEVTDQQPGTLTAHKAGPREPHGRGLHIVATLADRWGVKPAENGGKTVWFSLKSA